jgi:hypothetical protein
MTFEVIALLTASLAAATTTLTEEAVKGLLETDWNGTPEERKMIEDKVKQRPVLGSNDIMKRTAYAASPILKHIKDFGKRHVVNVAYVPHLMGKTTACHAIMKKYVKEGTNRGICFSPNDNSRPYLEHMVTLLGAKGSDAGSIGASTGRIGPYHSASSKFSLLTKCSSLSGDRAFLQWLLCDVKRR